jgi:hypothetical protein
VLQHGIPAIVWHVAADLGAIDLAALSTLALSILARAKRMSS